MSDKNSQELLSQLQQAFAGLGTGEVHLVDLYGETDNSGQDETDYLLSSKENEIRLMESITQLERGDLEKLIEWNEKDLHASLTDLEELLREPPSEINSDIKTKSQFAAYSYDKTTPVPLPPSITTEAHAVQYMEKQGYTHFEVYRKLGTYKAETKTEMVRQ